MLTMWTFGQSANYRFQCVAERQLSPSPPWKRLHLHLNNSSAHLHPAQGTHLSAITRHTHLHTVKRKFICFVCGDKFRQKSVLNGHIQSQHNKENNICKPCGYVFNNKLDCNIHINNCQSDTINKPHKCNYCGYRFKRKHNLTAHIRTHTGERPFRC